MHALVHMSCSFFFFIYDSGLKKQIHLKDKEKKNTTKNPCELVCKNIEQNNPVENQTL